MVVDKINARLLPLELQITPADNRGWVLQGTDGNPTHVRFVALEDAIELALDMLISHIREEARDHAAAFWRP
jgi:hypothetical protein